LIKSVTLFCANYFSPRYYDHYMGGTYKVVQKNCYWNNGFFCCQQYFLCTTL